jgi:zinc and cadmium transporter
MGLTLFWIVLATLASGLLSVLAAAAIALSMARTWIPYLVSFAVGVLLTAAFLDLLPESAESLPLPTVLATTLAGIFAFFVLEKFALWYHSHALGAGTNAERKPAGPMILVGDGLHNFADGILLAAAFLTDIELGAVTTLAVVAHEIPREMGDFGILLDSGFSKRQALVWNVTFSVAAVLGGVIGYFGLSIVHNAIPYVLALSAASFIYIAIADLVPGLHQAIGPQAALAQSLMIGLGIGIMSTATSMLI